MKKCPYCNSDKGVFTAFVAYQYYSWEGNPMGYSDGDTESVFARCISCNRKISMKRILRESNKE